MKAINLSPTKRVNSMWGNVPEGAEKDVRNPSLDVECDLDELSEDLEELYEDLDKTEKSDDE